MSIHRKSLPDRLQNGVEARRGRAQPLSQGWGISRAVTAYHARKEGAGSGIGTLTKRWANGPDSATIEVGRPARKVKRGKKERGPAWRTRHAACTRPTAIGTGIGIGSLERRRHSQDAGRGRRLAAASGGVRRARKLGEGHPQACGQAREECWSKGGKGLQGGETCVARRREATCAGDTTHAGACSAHSAGTGAACMAGAAAGLRCCFASRCTAQGAATAGSKSRFTA